MESLPFNSRARASLCQVGQVLVPLGPVLWESRRDCLRRLTYLSIERTVTDRHTAAMCLS